MEWYSPLLIFFLHPFNLSFLLLFISSTLPTALYHYSLIYTVIPYHSPSPFSCYLSFLSPSPPLLTDSLSISPPPLVPLTSHFHLLIPLPQTILSFNFFPPVSLCPLPFPLPSLLSVPLFAFLFYSLFSSFSLSPSHTSLFLSRNSSPPSS